MQRAQTSERTRRTRALRRIAIASLATLLVSVGLAGRGATSALPDALPPDGEAQLGSLGPDLRAELDRHRLVILPREASEAGPTQGLVLFERPPAEVWSLLRRVERQREYRPELTHVAAVDRFENGVVDRHHIRILFFRLAYHLRYEFLSDAWRILWALDPRFENDVQEISGSWDLFGLPVDRTLGRFGTTVRVGAALPRSLEDAVTRKNVPETLENVRRWVDSGGKWRP